MSERPILFNADMVRAVLAGRKTQTRRVIKPEWFRCLDLEDPADVAKALESSPFRVSRLWVRETWAVGSIYDAVKPSLVDSGAKVAYVADARPSGLKLRPSIFMPRWVSRTTLDITSVRVERLQDISAEDAKAEGLHCLTKDNGQTYKYGIGCAREGWPGSGRKDDGWRWTDWDVDPRKAFAFLWDSINGKRAGCSWADNPWLWCVDFKLIEGRS